MVWPDCSPHCCLARLTTVRSPSGRGRVQGCAKSVLDVKVVYLGSALRLCVVVCLRDIWHKILRNMT